MGLITKLVVSTAALAAAFYAGTQNPDIISRYSPNIPFVTQSSPKEKLKFEDVKTQAGLETKLKNTETGEFLYTLQPDGFPDTQSFYSTIDQRLDSLNQEELAHVYTNTKELGKKLVSKLYGNLEVEEGMVNPSDISISIRTNKDQKLETMLNYKGNSVQLSQKDVEQLVKLGEQVPEEKSSGFGILPYLIAGACVVGLIAYRVKKT